MEFHESNLKSYEIFKKILLLHGNTLQIFQNVVIIHNPFWYEEFL